MTAIPLRMISFVAVVLRCMVLSSLLVCDRRICSSLSRLHNVASGEAPIVSFIDTFPLQLERREGIFVDRNADPLE